MSCLCGKYKIHLPSEYRVVGDNEGVYRCKYCGKKIIKERGVWIIENKNGNSISEKINGNP